MPLQKERFSAEDYWTLSGERRAELIDGRLYDMAPPSRIHQKLVSELTQAFGAYIKRHNGACDVYPAPFAVNLDGEDNNWVEPDISIICNKNKLTEQGCKGAPDLIIEIVSPSSRKLDYAIKAGLYADAGVREYWIVDPMRKVSMIYYFAGEDSTPTMYPFGEELPCSIFEQLKLRIDDLI